MANNAPLIGNGDRYFGGFIQNNALATQAAFEPRIEGPVNKIFLFIRYSFNKIFPAFHIHVAGGAGANPAAVVVEVNIVFFRDFQDGHILKTSRHRLDWNAFIFKLELDGGHV